MSADDLDFSKAVESALQEEANKDGSMITGFVGFATLIDNNGEPTYISFRASGQTVTASTGMIEILKVENDARIVDKYREREE